MGGPISPGLGPGENGVIPLPPDLTGLLQILIEIRDVLKSTFEEGGSKGEIGLESVDTGGTFKQLWTSSFKVKKGIIQNISTEDVTITTFERSTISQGIILNAASSSGKGGGSLPIGNVDLQDFWFVRASSGLTLAYYIER